MGIEKFWRLNWLEIKKYRFFDRLNILMSSYLIQYKRGNKKLRKFSGFTEAAEIIWSGDYGASDGWFS